MSDRLPKRMAFWIDTVTPKYVWNKELHLEISSSLLEGPSLAEDSSRLCTIMFSCLFSFSFCSALTETAILATDSSVIGGAGPEVLEPGDH